MSMLSAQVDELRELATRYDELQVGSVKAVTMPSNMGSILREAADTIWELRDDLQQANAKNVKLQEERDTYRDLVDCMVHPDIPDQLAAENAKLRELAAETCRYINHPFDASWTHLRRKEARDSINDRMRKLGIEVER